MPTSIPEAKKDLANHLKSLRQAAGLSLDEVAQRAGLTKGHIWELEKGRVNNPTINSICRLAIALDANPKEIAGFAIKECMTGLVIETKTERFVAK